MSKYEALTIEKMPMGGFVVIEGMTDFNRHMLRSPLFACSDIVDALAFVHAAIGPPITAPASVGEKSLCAGDAIGGGIVRGHASFSREREEMERRQTDVGSSVGFGPAGI